MALGLAWVSLGAFEGAVRIMSSLVACLVGRFALVAAGLRWDSALVSVRLELR